jgi:predicted NAD/FAD-binding protein
MLERLGDRLMLRLNAPVQQVTRHDTGVQLTLAASTSFRSGDLCLPLRQALAMLADATSVERDVLGAIGWQRNEVVLHRDRRWLPVRERAWASWNYRLSGQDLARACHL